MKTNKFTNKSTFNEEDIRNEKTNNNQLSFKSYIKDTYKGLTTKTLLHDHEGMTDYEKIKVFKILSYLANHDLLYNQNDKYNFAPELRKKMITLIKNISTIDELKNKIEDCESDECMFAHAIHLWRIRR